uniref:signal recognition particle subunit SRP68-like n=1 Tax=Styela clava TaxID=7725 RepID=UPI00193A5214|nr:signal recognition particle subunit SRP68-like [Styela clava]
METSAQTVDEVVEGETEQQNEKELSKFGVDILHVIKEAQAQHGLRHGDYQRYHGYCNRRIRRLRKVLGLKMGEKKKVVPKVINESLMTDSRYILLIVMAVERAWSYAMQLKQEASDNLRKRHHMIQRMKKATFQAEHLNNLCEKSPIVDARTKLEAKAYASYINGIFCFECQNWKVAMELFNASKTIYGKLCETKSKEERVIYDQMMDDISPNIRYCAYNIGDQSAMDDLLQLRASHKQDVLLADKLDSLVIQAKEQKATSMSEFVWKKHTIPVKNNKVRIFLLSQKSFEKEMEENKSKEEQLEMFESILTECKDALQCVREEINLDKSRDKNVVSNLDLLYTYLNYTCILMTVKRNLLMAEDLESKSPARLTVLKRNEITAESTMQSPKANLSVRKVKLSDFIRLYDIILQNILEIPTMKGLSEDLDLLDAMSTQEQAFRGLKCFYVAEAYGEQGKWKEAMALYEKVLTHAKKAIDGLKGINRGSEEHFINVEQLDGLVETIAFNKYHVHASAVMQASESTAENDEFESKMLQPNEVFMDNLDNYFDSSSFPAQASSGSKTAEVSPKLTSHFPPSFVPVPNKPLFFDLALNHVTFPSLDDKIASKAKAQGISGYIKSFWGWGGKK